MPRPLRLFSLLGAALLVGGLLASVAQAAPSPHAKPATAQHQPPISAAPPGSPLLLGMIPAYPGATRPLPAWERRRLAIAMTKDKPDEVLTYYIDRLSQMGWQPAAGAIAEASAALHASEPAWMTFSKQGVGYIDLQVVVGPHPKTQQPMTVIYYSRTETPL